MPQQPTPETVPEDQSPSVITPDSASFRTVLGNFATGVTVVTTIDGDEPIGVAANAFTSVSLDPPLVLFCVARESTTWPRIERSGRFTVNILGEHQENVCRTFATRGIDRFAEIDWHVGAGGSPVLHGVLAFLDCELWATYDGGDHVIVVGRVVDLGVTHDAGPLLFFRGGYGRIGT